MQKQPTTDLKNFLNQPTKGEKLMFAKRIFLALIVTAMMAIGATAQSNERRDKWAGLTRSKDQTGAPSVEAAGTGAQMQSRDDAQVTARGEQSVEVAAADDSKGKIEGTWRVTPEIFSDIKSLFTFGAGSDANAGTVVHSANVSFVPSPSCINGQGTWKRTGERTFIGTDETFCFDANNGFVPAGKIKFRYAITINDRGTEFNGRAVIEGFDPDGNMYFSADGPLHGVRMQAQAP